MVVAAQRAGGLEDRGVPVGDFESLPGGDGGEYRPDRGLLDGEAPEGVDQPSGLLVGQAIGAGLAGRLDVELLEHLD
jgi:hypothetical protein